MENIPLPNKIHFEAGERPNEGVLVVEPCFHGYGTTLGNALRRVLLSSLPGAAVTAVNIKGAKHEFQAIDNVKEDALEVILNLKGLRMKVFTDQPVKLSLSVTGKKIVTAADFEGNSDVEIVNSDLKIATLTDDKGTFELEVTVQRGRGYVPTEAREDEDHDIGSVAIDALFSPVRNVGYRVENTRVGDITNYDKLLVNIETDGSITPEEAVQEATKLLIDHFSLLGQAAGGMSADTAPEASEEPQEVPVEETEADESE
jgi:DNA-directed RNA polymerase subunit alpha